MSPSNILISKTCRNFTYLLNLKETLSDSIAYLDLILLVFQTLIMFHLKHLARKSHQLMFRIHSSVGSEKLLHTSGACLLNTFRSSACISHLSAIQSMRGKNLFFWKTIVAKRFESNSCTQVYLSSHAVLGSRELLAVVELDNVVRSQLHGRFTHHRDFTWIHCCYCCWSL